MTQSADIFTELREFSWRGIGFPVASTRFSFEHDQKDHAWADRDGVRIEPTGRGALLIHAAIPLVNGIEPGPMETWQGPLYPTVFRSLIAALLDRSSGELNHPEFGKLTCCPKMADGEWVATMRDGVVLSATWRQTNEAEDELAQAVAAPSPITTAVQYGAALDTQLAESPALPQLPQFEPSFSDSMRSIQGAFDSVSLASAQVQGQIDHVVYRVKALSDAAVRAGDVQLWPVINSCERLKSAMADLRKTLLVANKKIAIYLTTKPLTLAQIAITKQAKLGDLLSLNPRLAALPIVPEQTSVRYYAA